MLKLFILILLIIYIGYVVHKKKRFLQKSQKPKLDELVKCANCGVYVSKRNGFYYKKLFFCSKQCKRQYEDKIRREV